MKTIEVPLDAPLSRRFPGSRKSDNLIQGLPIPKVVHPRGLGRTVRLTLAAAPWSREKP